MAAKSGIWAGLTKPNDDELEVVVFGPGVGECIVLHLGMGRWIVVDSCVNPKTKRPVALDYFDAIGLDPGAVRLVLATHWHDDHVKGISDLFSVTPNAKFACSQALDYDEFFTLIGVGRRAPFVSQSSGLDEFRYMLDELTRRSTKVRPEAVAPIFASEAQVLYQSSTGLEAKLWAMSPSPATIQLAQHAIARLVPSPGSPPLKIVRQTPNADSVVAWTEVAGVRVLLGADLEDTANAATGWKAIVESERLPEGKALVVKVPHHGSKNAHNEDVWERRIEPHAIAAVTPFTKQGLPRSTDLKRMVAKSGEVYCTAKRGKLPRRSSAVDTLAARVAKNRRVLVGKLGFVRLRLSLSSTKMDVNVSVHGGAYKVA